MSKEESKPITISEYMYAPKITTRVGFDFNISPYLEEYDDMEAISEDGSALEIKDSVYVTAKKAGTSSILLKHGDLYQRVEVEVLDEEKPNWIWSFKELDTAAKLKIVAFGDSVTANATIGADLTYVRNIANLFGLRFVRNYAIGGTTATYMYPGSNIDKEYHGNTTAIDGPRVVQQAVSKGELKDIDIAFIAFGHNDHYFQPPISVDGDDTYNIDNFDNAHSFKGSYRYMINSLRHENPNMKIILLDCTYSEYMKDGGPYGNANTYDDYRHAIYELAEEMECKMIDPWNHLKPYFDGNGRNIYYKDVVHLTVKGHEKLGDYLKDF